MKTKAFNWAPFGAEYRAEMPNNVTLVASPDRVTNFGTKPKRGTFWHAQASQWDGKYTISRYGRDEYSVKHKTAKDAMRAAERIYLGATGPVCPMHDRRHNAATLKPVPGYHDSSAKDRRVLS